MNFEFKKHGAPPKYVREMTNEELHERIARIIYLSPGGKMQAAVAAENIILMLRREGKLRLE